VAQFTQYRQLVYLSKAGM